jgi:site-specific recombinase XerD
MKICSGTPTWREALEFFFKEYLPYHRGFSPRTLESYATALRLLSEGIDTKLTGPHELEVPAVLDFLKGLEQRRNNTASTRNLRLAALKSFWKALLLLDPAHRERYDHLLTVPFKRSAKRSPDYLEPEELKRLFDSVDARTPAGFRDLVILRYTYNTGSRISEVAQARTDWFTLAEQSEVTIRGKGGKWRVCPLWPTTAAMLRVYLQQERARPRKGYEEFLFITRLGTAFTRGGLWKMIHGRFGRIAMSMPSLSHKHLTPHSLRHATAVHLLRAGVDINVIKSWLGHADVSTTSGYLDLDLDKKREALELFLKLDMDRLTGDSKIAQIPLPANIVGWLERL